MTFQRKHPSKKSHANNTLHRDELRQVVPEIKRIGDIMKQQNRLHRRFLSGVVFGAGTAVGASIIAGIVALLLRKFLHSLGIDISQLLI
ncbi:MAG: DUF5665 domain-containing protein [bacterium]|nr:DUF5665 domain-containing protein [bacterium]